ncbi:unnamed protein product [Oppiella nova]|uniref:Uncharacterized protein n=1 Tax=Oppiella nova TaxID=334625 RepID=A0A7R9QX54_9ACAR|nr:unnamed protein product [Oppiella nova]CAG2177663.1 unnamed protein product [Oppiella nova]
MKLTMSIILLATFTLLFVNTVYGGCPEEPKCSDYPQTCTCGAVQGQICGARASSTHPNFENPATIKSVSLYGANCDADSLYDCNGFRTRAKLLRTCNECICNDNYKGDDYCPWFRKGQLPGSTQVVNV